MALDIRIREGESVSAMAIFRQIEIFGITTDKR